MPCVSSRIALAADGLGIVAATVLLDRGGLTSATGPSALSRPWTAAASTPAFLAAVDPNTGSPASSAEVTRGASSVARPERRRRTVDGLAAELRWRTMERPRTSPWRALLGLLALVFRDRLGLALFARASVLYAPAAIALGLAWRSSLAIGFGALALPSRPPFPVARWGRSSSRSFGGASSPLALAGDQRTRDDRPAPRRWASFLRRHEPGGNDAPRARVDRRARRRAAGPAHDRLEQDRSRRRRLDGLRDRLRDLDPAAIRADDTAPRGARRSLGARASGRASVAVDAATGARAIARSGPGFRETSRTA